MVLTAICSTATAASYSMTTHKKASQGPHGHKTISSSTNYISIGMKRFIELSVPVISIINSLNPSQRLVALLAVTLILFWPLLLLAINLPWMLTAVAIGYIVIFGVNKFVEDVKSASKEHLNLNVDEKCALISKKLETSEFPGKDALLCTFAQGKGLAMGLYRSGLEVAIYILDLIATLLLNFAKFVRSNLITSTTPAASSKPAQEQPEPKQD